MNNINSSSLSKLLADTYALYLKTQNYHWNIKDKNFYSLHKMFQEQYEDLAEAIDEIAERIRALGDVAPGSFEEFMNLTKISKPIAVFSREETIKDLLKGHEYIISKLKKYIKDSDEISDYSTSDLLTQRLSYHQKCAWILSSSL